MKVGKYTYGTQHLNVTSWGEGTELKIGSFCSIGANIKIFLGGNHRTDWVTTYPFGHVNNNKFKILAVKNSKTLNFKKHTQNS